jgi:hypothetical protein
MFERKQAIESAKAFLGNSHEVVKIIEYCNLFPIKTWKAWTDHHDNYLKIHGKNRIISTTYEPKTIRDRIVTDIYFNSKPEKISSITKWAFVSFGKSDHDDVCFIWMLGNDDRLRLVSYSEKKWNRNQPPLISGVNTLRPILRNLDVEGFSKADIIQIKGPGAAKITKSWASEWPPSELFLNEMSKYNSKLSKEIELIARNK